MLNKKLHQLKSPAIRIVNLLTAFLLLVPALTFAFAPAASATGTVAGDINQDGVVNIMDLSLLLSSYGSSS